MRKVHEDKQTNYLTLENGLVRRTWKLKPNVACVQFENLMTDRSMLRSVRPEARLTIDGN